MRRKTATPLLELKANGYNKDAIDKLASSGLSVEDAKVLGIEFLTKEETKALHPDFREMSSLKINYIDPLTGLLQTDHPGWAPFYRVRFLIPPDSFAAQGKLARKYMQPPETGACAYFPVIELRWKEILANASLPLIITEGELKAACACKFGYPTIGLGGVDMWRSAKLGISFLPELEMINWVKRNVYIIFDSDIVSNPDVCRALNQLAEQLYMRGAIPHFVLLPKILKEGKTGLDDFLVDAKNPNELRTLIHTTAQPITLARALWELRERVRYIHDPGCYLVHETGQIIKPYDFVHSAFSTEYVNERVLKPNGELSQKEISKAEKYNGWPLREESGRMDYLPGKLREIPGTSSRTSIWNRWPGWGCEPKKSERAWGKFIQLVKFLFAGSAPGDREYFLHWLAYPLRHPGTKTSIIVVMHSPDTGSGKSFIGYIMGEIYGQNFVEIPQSEFQSPYNNWASDRQFVMVDDFEGTDRKKDGGHFKHLATQKKEWVNKKYGFKIEYDDCKNYYITSNQAAPLDIEDKDRRIFVNEVISAALETSFYEELDQLLRSGELAPAVFYGLLNMDDGDFNPYGHARKTLAREIMIESGKTDLELWVADLMRAPDIVLMSGRAIIEGDLLTSKDLVGIYQAQGGKDITINLMSSKLTRAGFRQVCGKQQIEVPGRLPDRYWPIRNREKWMKAKPEAVKSYLMNFYNQNKIGGV